MKAKKLRKQGYALVTSMFMMMVLVMVVGMMIRSSAQRMHAVRHATNKARAMACAEAGISYAYSILSLDFDQRNNPAAFSAGSTGSIKASSSVTAGGSFKLKVRPIDNRRVVITSTGQFGGVSKTAEVLVEDMYASGVDDTESDVPDNAFEYGILCGKELHFTGCGTINAPKGTMFHANGAMVLKGTTDARIDLTSSIRVEATGNSRIYGNVKAPEVKSEGASKILGSVSRTRVAQVTIPDIDLTPYYNWALDHGEVHSGFSSSSSYTPNGGILWVNGDVKLSGGPGTTINGSIIATGEIKISGQVNVSPTICKIGMATRDGEIQISSTGTMKGLLYCKKSNLHMTANGTVIGQIIVNGDIEKAGNSDILGTYVQSIPSVPGTTESAAPTKHLPVITAWQK